MKTLIAAACIYVALALGLALLVISNAGAQEYCEGMARPSDTAPCPSANTPRLSCDEWAANATHGGAQALRGKKRQLHVFTRGLILEQFAASGVFSVEGIAVFDGEYDEPAIFFGYDWVTANLDAVPASAKAAHEMFRDICTLYRSAGQ